MPSIPVLSPAESEAWDAQAEQAGIRRDTLMDAAGRAAAAVLARRFGTALDAGAVIAAGLGNNGGDGWVLARALHRADVSVWVASPAGARSALCEAARAHAIAQGVRELPPDGPWPAPGLAVDALLGTGARGAPRPPVESLLERLRDLRVPLVALDGPTGLDLGTGVVHGTPRADLSITFGGVRRGHLLARDEAGEIIVVDIGQPAPDAALPRLVTDVWAARHLPRFTARDHKGDRGRIVLIGGAPGMSGALRLAARAALAAGAGYVHAVAPPESMAELRSAEPDLLTLEQRFDGAPSAHLLDLVERADCVIAGPGLGRGDGRSEFLEAALSRARAVVMDADAITVFQGAAGRLQAVVAGREAVITPHPGEFRTLFPDLAAERELDPWCAAGAASERLGAALLLKGVPTVVAVRGAALWTVAAGNPGLGTGGSGDVLSGITGTLVAQGCDSGVSAALAAQALGEGGDLAARRVSARAMRPMDVIAALPDVWRMWGDARGRGAGAALPIMATLPAPRLV
ncbi:MAG TPA: NAD(P)H-hydrate dehydratase [Gemmatimonadales bacterium]|nr:NAD(P)H-hydrate dehydratase [Gemmatimonadales bacterium]